jgi:tetratricopeptide (TPR) repeat protein
MRYAELQAASSRVIARVRYRNLGLASLLLLSTIGTGAVPGKQPLPASEALLNKSPETPREFFNAGTILLQQGKFREAEAFLEASLSAQEASLQPPASYNLGHVRFAQGVEELKRSVQRGPSMKRGENAGALGKSAISDADDALRSRMVDRMLAAYFRGRGVRKEIRSASTAIKRALEAHSAALLKWQRASGDFHSAAELDPGNRDAVHNAEVVDRHIARLIDSIRELQQMAAMLGKENEELKEKMKQLRGMIPEQDMPPGAAGEEDEEEEQPDPKQGEQEAPTRDGKQMELTPEQAAWLLEGFRLDRERRLPMGGTQPPDPRNRNKPDW